MVPMASVTVMMTLVTVLHVMVAMRHVRIIVPMTGHCSPLLACVRSRIRHSISLPSESAGRFTERWEPL